MKRGLAFLYNNSMSMRTRYDFLRAALVRIQEQSFAKQDVILLDAGASLSPQMTVADYIAHVLQIADHLEIVSNAPGGDAYTAPIQTPQSGR